MMNIIRNATRCIVSLNVPRVFSLESSNFCTAVSVKSENEQTQIITEARPDKLFKRLELEIRGNDPAVIRSYVKFSTMAASHLNVEVEKSWPQRKSHKERHTLLKSVHVHKKHRVQYEIRTYFHFIHMVRLTESTTDTLLEYLERNLPEGIAMKATKVEIQPLPDYLLPPNERKKQ